LTIVNKIGASVDGAIGNTGGFNLVPGLIEDVHNDFIGRADSLGG